MNEMRKLQYGFPFVVGCLAILRSHGVPKGRGRVYDDGVVRIEQNGDSVEVIRLANRNPVIMCEMPQCKRVNIFCWHGEVAQIADHVASLCMEQPASEQEEDMSDALVQINDVWTDLDPRANGRQLKVLSIEGDSALVQHPTGLGPRRKIRLDRMKQRGSRGYKLIERDGQRVEAGTNPSPVAA